MSVDPVKLTQDLIRCPSVTPRDEGAQKVMTDPLEEMGFEVFHLPFENIINFFARLDGPNKNTNGPHICYCGHTDVVPAGDENSWTYPPFAAEIHDGVLYGRGASDMKSNNAAFIAAVAEYIADHGIPNGSISLLITGDEEGDAINGTVKVLEWMEENGHVPDMALVGEPSNPDQLGEQIKVGRRGSLNGILTVTGKQGHSAYPERADNPLPRLIRLLNALENHEFDQGTEFFQPTNLEIVTIDVGNTALNVIPEKGTAKFNIRYNDTWTHATLDQQLRDVLDAVGEPYGLETYGNAQSFLTEPCDFTHHLRDSVSEITGRTPEFTTGGGTSDARFVTHYCDVAEFGVLNKTIHQVDEHVRTEDILTLTAVYKRLLEKIFNTEGQAHGKR